MVRVLLGRPNPLQWAALLMVLACDSHASKAVPLSAGALTPPATLRERDLDAYAVGTRAGIDYLRRSNVAGLMTTGAQADSIGAHAAGMTIPEFRAVRRLVEAALKSQAVLASRARQLDSLRIEAMVLRVRAEAGQVSRTANH